MSLFSTIQQSANALSVNELGLHVVGNNVANANTPGYLRQELIQTPSVPGKRGDAIVGNGVRAVGVRQKVDNFLVERLRQTESELASSAAKGDIYNKIESILGELTDNDLSSQLADFSNSIHDVLNQPGNDSLRRLVIERGKLLTGNIRQIGQQLETMEGNINTEIQGVTGEINRLTESIAKLNTRIVELEGGRTSGSDAVGLRDERLVALQDLSKLVDIRAVEQASGSVSVFVGGEYLVAEGIQRKVYSAVDNESSPPQPQVLLEDTNSPLEVTGGRLHGLYGARDGAIDSTLNSLDDFAQNLIREFNLLHSPGQGLDGFTEITSNNAADDPLGPVDLAGFPIQVENGEFEIQVTDKTSGISETHAIRIKLQGGLDDTTLEDIAANINAISGLESSVNLDGTLRINSSNDRLEFSFQNDNSNFLAAAGINTFFVGDSATTIDLSSTVANDPRKFAASNTGVGSGTGNALAMAQAFDNPVDGLDGRSIKQAYEDIVVRTSQDINVESGVTDGLRNFYRTLESQHLATSGVNLDEEAVKMIFYQRAYQASSRVIQASAEMLDTLVNL
ncbi:MAG TPA: flagellar hook-associated protein FlgK [Planctomycetaceae bacterium]|nr:flagellar hook-associated protein FlgK [Planctomycetaceae bacterium]